MRTEFKFECAKGEWLAKKFGVAPAEEDVHERLRAAGCSRSCRRCDGDGIRTCRRSASIREYRPTGVDDLRVGQNQRLRTARHSALDEGLTQEESGELKVEAELGRAKAPVAERFRELLDRAVRIAKISAEANPR